MNWSSWLKGLLFTAIGGAITPAVTSVAHGNLSPSTIGLGALVGAATSLLAYLHPSPTQQTSTTTTSGS